MSQIAWKIFCLGLYQLSNYQTNVKICNDLIATSNVLYCWNSQPTNKCHMCNKFEDHKHLIICQSSPRKKWRKKYIFAIQKLLIFFYTSFELIEPLSRVLSEYWNPAQKNTILLCIRRP